MSVKPIPRNLIIWLLWEGEFPDRHIHNLTTHKVSDYFGLDGDAFNQVPENVSTVVDLLEDKGISWGMYQEDQPYSGFQGFAWVNQKTGANDYVRKHK